LQQLADPGAANRAISLHQRLYFHHLESYRSSQLRQRLHRSRSIPPEGEVATNPQHPKWIRPVDPAHELTWRLPGELGGKPQCIDALYAQRVDQPPPLLNAGKPGRSALGMHHAVWMGLKGNAHGLPSPFARVPNHLSNQVLVAAMYPIEHANGKLDGARAGCSHACALGNTIEGCQRS